MIDVLGFERILAVSLKFSGVLWLGSLGEGGEGSVKIARFQSARKRTEKETRSCIYICIWRV